MKTFIRIAALIAVLTLTPTLAQTPSPGNRSVTLSWSPVTSATGYNVYKAQTACASATFAKITPSPITTTSFSESGLADGVTRCYYVTALNNAGESTPSGTVQITTPTYTAPSGVPIISTPTSIGAGVQ